MIKLIKLAETKQRSFTNRKPAHQFLKVWQTLFNFEKNRNAFNPPSSNFKICGRSYNNHIVKIAVDATVDRSYMRLRYILLPWCVLKNTIEPAGSFGAMPRNSDILRGATHIAKQDCFTQLNTGMCAPIQAVKQPVRWKTSNTEEWNFFNIQTIYVSPQVLEARTACLQNVISSKKMERIATLF